MSRVVVILCVLGLLASAPVDSESAGTGDPIELAAVDVALPVAVVPVLQRLIGERWVDQARDTGRELSTSIFRPPV